MNTDPSAGALYLDAPLAKSSDAEAAAAVAYIRAHAPDPDDVIAALFTPLAPCRSRHHTGGPA